MNRSTILARGIAHACRLAYDYANAAQEQLERGFRLAAQGKMTLDESIKSQHKRREYAAKAEGYQLKARQLARFL